MSTLEADELAFARSFTRNWWIWLVTGILWLVFSLVVFRFDISSAKSIGVLAGIMFLVAGLFELVVTVAVDGVFWKILNGLVAVALMVGGIMSFVRPGNAFVAVASITGFMFLAVGILDIVVALATKAVDDLWWIRLTLGIAAVLLALWASGDFERKAILLVIWVGVFALTRGIGSLVFAFQVRRVDKALAAV